MSCWKTVRVRGESAGPVSEAGWKVDEVIGLVQNPMTPDRVYVGWSCSAPTRWLRDVSTTNPITIALSCPLMYENW